MELLAALAQQGEFMARGMTIAMVIMWVLCLVGVVAWVWALVDAIRNPNLDDTMRIVWVLVIILTNILGAVLYFLLRSSTARMARGDQPSRP